MSLFRHLLGLFCLAALGVNAAEVAWEPAMRDDTEYWARTVKQQAETMKQAQAKIIFIGDSLTESWDKGIWQMRIAPAQALNFGMGAKGRSTCSGALSMAFWKGLRRRRWCS